MSSAILSPRELQGTGLKRWDQQRLSIKALICTVNNKDSSVLVIQIPAQRRRLYWQCSWKREGQIKPYMITPDVKKQFINRKNCNRLV